MYAFKLITAVSAFAAFACADSSFTGEPFEITNVKVDRQFSGNFELSFTVYDPDPLTNATQSCSGSWKFGSKGYPQGTYAGCGNSTFGWNMVAFHGYQSFTLGLQHRFTDPSVGDPPYDQVITFGDAVVNRRNLGCQKDGASVSCSQKIAIIEAPVDRVIS